MRRFLGLERKNRQPPLWRLLEETKRFPYAADWARGYGTDVIGVWSECPRSDWLVLLAVKVGVDNERVVTAINSCIEEASRISALVPPVGREALDALDDWVAGNTPIEHAVDLMLRCIEQAIEDQPDVREAWKIARRFNLVDRYEESYHLAHRRFANLIREHLPSEYFESAYHGLEHGPYR